VILAPPESEFGLHKDVFAMQHSSPQLSLQCPSYVSFAVMPALIGGVNPTKSHPQRLRNEICGPLFFPGCPIEQGWHCRPADLPGALCHLSSDDGARISLSRSVAAG
jgi:hypothetical protein